jgi:hypothetical protein
LKTSLVAALSSGVQRMATLQAGARSDAAERAILMPQRKKLARRVVTPRGSLGTLARCSTLNTLSGF